MACKLFLIIGCVLLVQLVIAETAAIGGLDSEADPLYRLFNSDLQPCNGEECLYHAYKRSPNELILNRDSLVTLLRHMYPKTTSFTSPFLGKRAIQLKKRSILEQPTLKASV